MFRKLWIGFILIFSLVACTTPVTPTAVFEPIPPGDSETVQTLQAAPTADTAAVGQGKIAAPSFEAQTYINETVGFALEYPAQWTAQETKLGDRGSQVQLLSAPEIAEQQTVSANATRITILINQWDPKNDLAAFADMRKTAWAASGFTVLSEETLTLDLGLAALRFTVQTPEGVTVPFLFAAVGDQYLSISGEGDLTLFDEIVQRLRPVGNS